MKFIPLLFLIAVTAAAVLPLPIVSSKRRVAAGGSWSVTTPSTPIAGYKADNISGSDGDLLSSWPPDYGPTLTNSGGGVRPTLKTDGPNSRRYVKFNADNLTYLASTNFLGGTVSQPYTIAITWNNWAHSSFNYVWDGNDGTLRCFMYDQSSSMNIGATTTGLAQFGSDEGTWHQLVVIINGSSSEYSLDNGSWASLTDPGSSGIDGLTLGARNDTFNNSYVQIGEFYLWSGAFGSSDKSGSTNYFSTRWH